MERAGPGCGGQGTNPPAGRKEPGGGRQSPPPSAGGRRWPRGRRGVRPGDGEPPPGAAGGNSTGPRGLPVGFFLIPLFFFSCVPEFWGIVGPGPGVPVVSRPTRGGAGGAHKQRGWREAGRGEAQGGGNEPREAEGVRRVGGGGGCEKRAPRGGWQSGTQLAARRGEQGGGGPQEGAGCVSVRCDRGAGCLCVLPVRGPGRGKSGFFCCWLFGFLAGPGRGGFAFLCCCFVARGGPGKATQGAEESEVFVCWAGSLNLVFCFSFLFSVFFFFFRLFVYCLLLFL